MKTKGKPMKTKGKRRAPKTRGSKKRPKSKKDKRKKKLPARTKRRYKSKEKKKKKKYSLKFKRDIESEAKEIKSKYNKLRIRSSARTQSKPMGPMPKGGPSMSDARKRLTAAQSGKKGKTGSGSKKNKSLKEKWNSLSNTKKALAGAAALAGTAFIAHSIYDKFNAEEVVTQDPPPTTNEGIVGFGDVTQEHLNNTGQDHDLPDNFWGSQAGRDALASCAEGADECSYEIPGSEPTVKITWLPGTPPPMIWVRTELLCTGTLTKMLTQSWGTKPWKTDPPTPMTGTRALQARARHAQPEPLAATEILMRTISRTRPTRRESRTRPGGHGIGWTPMETVSQWSLNHLVNTRANRQ